MCFGTWHQRGKHSFNAPINMFNLLQNLNSAGRMPSPFKRVMMFVDNAGADAVLGMIPLARELLCMGSDVVLVANSEPAINDITFTELAHLLDELCAPLCPIIALSRRAAKAAPFGTPDGDAACPLAGLGQQADSEVEHKPRLYVCASGATGPCLDLRRVSRDVAVASAGIDLVVIEGMGRAVHTNYEALFRCPALKLAMIKSKRVAEHLFGGKLFDCMCRFDDAVAAPAVT
jgi:bifunctional damage-control phosphatase, subfamily II, fusion protein